MSRSSVVVDEWRDGVNSEWRTYHVSKRESGELVVEGRWAPMAEWKAQLWVKAGVERRAMQESAESIERFSALMWSSRERRD